MRVENTIKNSAYSLASFCITAVLTIVLRKIFLNTLSVELLGYEGLFGNIFSILSLANLGIETLVLYRLFPAFAKQDKQLIAHIMSVYRVLYRYVGLVILIIGLILTPFLKYIIKQENDLNWSYVYFIYFISLAGVECTYYLSYIRIVFNVNQQEYECTKVDTVINGITTIVRIVTLIALGSYVLYLVCGFVSTLIGNLIISHKVKKRFSYIRFDNSVSWNDIRETNIFSEIKLSFVQQVCFVIYGATDSILVSNMFGIEHTGLLSNYLLLQYYVTSGLTKLLHPFQMSIGNYIYSDDAGEGDLLFRMFDFMSYFLACVVCVCYFNLLNPTCSLLFGEQFLLPMSFVLAFVVNQYIAWNHQFLVYYRQSFGKYELDTIPIVLAAVLNVVFSIILGKMMGIAGIFIGTAIGHLGIWFGRVKVVFHEYVKESVTKYFFRQALRAMCCVVQVGVTYMLCSNIPDNALGIMLRLVISLSFPIVFNLVVFSRTLEMKKCVDYLKKTLKMIQKKR